MRQIDSHLIADVALSTVEMALQDWRWLCPDVRNLILMSAVGDVFFEDSQGQVNRLDCGVGSIHPIARSRVAFEESADVADNQNEWFLRPVVQELRSKGVLLGSGQCYGFTILPIFREGSYGAANRFVLSATEHLRLTADIIQQIKDIPDGQSVELRVVD
jgi:hypothetical protein